MLGVVLCGGQSSRMGSDKGLLPGNGKAWAEYAYDKLQKLEIPVVISINPFQKSLYENVFPSKLLIDDLYTLGFKGPLAAVLTVHSKYPEEDLFVLACDMTDMETSIMGELFDHYRQKSSFEAFVFTIDGEPEPLCSIYSHKGLSAILRRHLTGEVFKKSMKMMVEYLPAMRLPVPEDKKAFFKNINDREALR
jgi:molybdopterin-guanine dinucleotide biosynthesis protein A